MTPSALPSLPGALEATGCQPRVDNMYDVHLSPQTSLSHQQIAFSSPIPKKRLTTVLSLAALDGTHNPLTQTQCHVPCRTQPPSSTSPQVLGSLPLEEVERQS